MRANKPLEFAWQIPGTHNVENATAAIAVLHNLGADFSAIQEGISSFKGIKDVIPNIFLKTEKFMLMIMHHPTELNAVIGSIRTFNPNKNCW